MALCTVIIGTHQRLSFLTESLDSALGQQGVDVEVIVVENGSTDGTVEYLKGLRDPRVVPLIFDEPLGGTHARSTGLESARGDWIGFLDDDDLWAPDKLRSQIEAAEATGRSWAYTGCVYIDGECEVIGGQPPLSPEEVARRLPVRYTVPAGTSSMIWRAGALPGGQALEPRLTYAIDWDLSLRLLSNGLPAGVHRPLVGYRQHGGNMSIGAATFLSELEVIDEKFRDMRQGRALDIAGEYRNAGSELARAGHKGKAMIYYFGAARRGDAGAVLRAAGIMMPRRFWPLLRRRFLSNEEWLESAEKWLSSHRARHRTPEPALHPLQAS